MTYLTLLEISCCGSYILSETSSQGTRVTVIVVPLVFRSRDIPTINIELVVTNVFPLKGSLQGGTKLTITGLGFSTNDSLVEVDVGDFMCDIQDLSNSQIICQIEEAVTVHSVTNLGTHKGM